MSLKLEAFVAPTVVKIANYLELAGCDLHAELPPKIRELAFQIVCDAQDKVYSMCVRREREGFSFQSTLNQAIELVEERRRERVVRLKERRRRQEERAAFAAELKALDQVLVYA